MAGLFAGVAAMAQRMSSTTWLNGYVHVDASRDVVYQVVLDACSLERMMWPLQCLVVVHRGSYQADADSPPVGRMLPGVLALRCCCTWTQPTTHFRHFLDLRLVRVLGLVVDAS